MSAIGFGHDHQGRLQAVQDAIKGWGIVALGPLGVGMVLFACKTWNVFAFVGGLVFVFLFVVGTRVKAVEYGEGRFRLESYKPPKLFPKDREDDPQA
jgi:hypothetical protein